MAFAFSLRSRRAAAVAVVALGLGVGSAAGGALGCDCVYDFRMSGRAAIPRTGDLVARACYEDECDAWASAHVGYGYVAPDAGPNDPRSVTYDVHAGGNGSRCMRPSRIELRLEGCEPITTVATTSDHMKDQDIELLCGVKR